MYQVETARDSTHLMKDFPTILRWRGSNCGKPDWGEEGLSISILLSEGDSVS